MHTIRPATTADEAEPADTRERRIAIRYEGSWRLGLLLLVLVLMGFAMATAVLSRDVMMQSFALDILKTMAGALIAFIGFLLGRFSRRSEP
jgi:hypothetical protein